MADNKTTIFQRIGQMMRGKSVPNDIITQPRSIGYTPTTDTVLYQTSNEEDYNRTLQQLKQQKLLSYQWVKAGADVQMDNLKNYTAIKLMYRDSDLMDSMPEIGAALDIISEESCSFGTDNKMIHITSRSKRVQSILEDLFINRLQIHVMLPMIARGMCKYGNLFMLLNVVQKDGVMGWMQLPTYEIDRIENGYGITSMGGGAIHHTNEIKPDEIKFVWQGHNNTNTEYKSWQIAHFRLLNDSFFLPYGTSVLHKARRAWRMLSMMEDSMLVYRLERSVERRVFKIYVGAIDDADVQGFVQEVANNFKRTPLIDPLTGQIDLRRSFLDSTSDYFIPVRDEGAPSPIETLPAAQNQTSMDDIQYMQNKIFAALRVPKTFLNFQEAQGKGQNLSLMDIRFSRMINRIQQFLIMELNKIAMIHLYLVGLSDELSNFTISMNNPSAQLDVIEMEDLTKRIQTAQSALADPGIGMPLMSYHMVLKKIMKLSDAEIKEMLNEIRLERAMAAELEATSQIIKRTGLFDSVDRIYGDYDALNAPPQAQQQDNGEMGGAPSGGMGGDMSGSLGGGLEGIDSGGDISGTEGSTDMASAPDVDNGGSTNESKSNNTKQLIIESMKKKNDISPKLKEIKSFTNKYFDMLGENVKKNEPEELIDFEGKNVFINEQIKNTLSKIEGILSDRENENIIENLDEENVSIDDID